MSVNRNEPTFHVVDAPEPPFHPDCGHYHDPAAECPVGRCDSYLCCVPGDLGVVDVPFTADLDPADLPADHIYENRAVYGICAKCHADRPLLSHAGLTACCHHPLMYI